MHNLPGGNANAVLPAAAIAADLLGQRQLAKLISRHGIAGAVNVNIVRIIRISWSGGIIIAESVIARIVNAIIIGLRHSVIVAVNIAIVILIAVIVAATVGGSIGIGIVIARAGAVIAIAAVRIALRSVNYHAAVGRLAVAAGDRHGFIAGR